MIDLHTHSTFSDGSYTPEELARMGAEAGLTALALTDHDCTSGLARFLKACAAQGVRGLGGVEISAATERGTLHILGYCVPDDHPELEAALRRIRGGREERNQRILERLNALGCELAWEEVARHAGEDVVGRPHFAAALIERGYVKTKQDAFDRLLAKGKPAYVDRFRFSPEDSIAAIRGAGGVAVLAHPFTLDLSDKALHSQVASYRDVGLQGVEVYYSEHDAARTACYLRLARSLGLVATGGSDFHGAVNPAVRLGVGFGNLTVPDDIVDALEALRGS